MDSSPQRGLPPETLAEKKCALARGRSGVVEMGENRTPRPEPDSRELPTGISGLLGVSPLPGPRPAGYRTDYPVLPLGSLTPLTGVGDAAPPLMTPSRPGEVGPRQCSLTKQRERTDVRCQLLVCPLFYEACEQPRPAIPGSRALSKPDIPTNQAAILADRCADVNTCSRRPRSADLLQFTPGVRAAAPTAMSTQWNGPSSRVV